MTSGHVILVLYILGDLVITFLHLLIFFEPYVGVCVWQLGHKKMYDAKQLEKASKAKKTREANEKALYLKLKKKFDKIDSK